MARESVGRKAGETTWAAKGGQVSKRPLGQATGRREILCLFGAAALESLPAVGSAGQGARPVLEAGGRAGQPSAAGLCSWGKKWGGEN